MAGYLPRGRDLETELSGFDQQLSILETALDRAQNAAHQVAENLIKAEEFISSSELRKQDLQAGLARLDAEMTEMRDRDRLLKEQLSRITESRGHKKP